MKTDIDVVRRLTLIVMIFSVGTIGLASMAPALASNTPGLTANDVVEGATNPLSFESNLQETRADAIGVYSTSVAVGGGCNAGGQGGLPVVPTGETGWVLRDASNGIAQIDVTGTNIVVNTPFGGGVTFTPAGGGITSINGPFYWDEIGTAADGVPNDSTDVGGNTPVTYSYVVCGEDGADSQSLSGFGAVDTWDIVAPVAGELIPINTSALLIAGIQANAFSILAALTTIGAASFGMLYLQNRKTNN